MGEGETYLRVHFTCNALGPNGYIHSQDGDIPIVGNKSEVQNSPFHVAFPDSPPSQLADHKLPARSRFLLCGCIETSTLVP